MTGYRILYQNLGAEFLASHDQLVARFGKIRAVLFDWDGVFHSGHKNEKRTSSFSETDSMGVNMLRFGLFLQNGSIPYTAIISGENNRTAKFWAEREHFNAVFSGVKDKKVILETLLEMGIESDEILFVFDDILDLSLAERVGLRCMVSRSSNPEFIEFVKKSALAEYISGSNGGNHAVREITEMLLNANGLFTRTIEHRIAYSETYQQYIQLRTKIRTDL
jgi:3-deoxy-D-manno-octulosonate 8-phosphate phosphatase (KDO 8-P phosphatase)